MEAINDATNHAYMLIMNDYKINMEFKKSLITRSSIHYLKKCTDKLIIDGEIPEYCKHEVIYLRNLAYILCQDMDILDELSIQVKKDAEKLWEEFSPYSKVRSNPCCETILLNPSEINSMKFETKQFINSKDVTSFSKSDLIMEIANAEAEVAKLKSIKTESKAIINEITRIEVFIAEVVKVLDSKE